MTIIEKNGLKLAFLANVPVWHIGHNKDVLVAVSIEVALRRVVWVDVCNTLSHPASIAII